jgi:hypothetical protein
MMATLRADRDRRGELDDALERGDEGHEDHVSLLDETSLA